MNEAFQQDAFQNNAFQQFMEPVLSGIAITTRFFSNMGSMMNRRGA